MILAERFVHKISRFCCRLSCLCLITGCLSYVATLTTYSFSIIATTTFMQACNDTTSGYTAAQRTVGVDMQINCLPLDSANQQISLIRATTPGDLIPAVNSPLVFSNGTQLTYAQTGSITLFMLRTPFTQAERRQYSKTFSAFPFVINGALIAHNILELVSVKSNPNGIPFNITQAMLLGIYTFDIKSFCDQRVLTANPFLAGTTFSDKCDKPASTWPKLMVGFRADRYLTTMILTRLLVSINKDAFPWDTEGFHTGADVKTVLKAKYPSAFSADFDPIFLSRQVGLGLYGWMTATPYSMIITTQEDVEKYGMAAATIQNKNNEFTTSSSDSVQAAMNAIKDNIKLQQGSGTMANLPGPGVYPLLDRSFIGITTGLLGKGYMPGSPNYHDCNVLAASIRFVKWVIDDGPQAMAQQVMTANYFVLQKPAATWYSRMVSRMNSMRCGDHGQSVLTTINNMETAEDMYIIMNDPLTWGLIIGGLVLSAVLSYFLAYHAFVFINRLRKESMEMYTIRNKDIRITPTVISPVDRYKGVVASRKVVDRYIPTASLQCLSTGTWGEHEVFLRPCSLVLHKLRHAAKMRVLELAEISHHKNVVTFYGLTELPNGRCLVCNFCPFGDLRTLIIAKKYTFTMNIKFSIAGDICEGMEYLHGCGVVHGNLRSCAIYVEANWAAKVSDYEYDTLHQKQGTFHPTVCQLKSRLNLYQQTSLYPWLYWTAPEILQQGITGREIPPLRSADVFSFGIVCSEIFSMEPAYQKYQELPYKLTPAQILNGILTADMRPREERRTSTTPRCVHRVMEHCWQEHAEHRPSFMTLRKLFRSVNSMRRSLADRIMISAEKTSVAVKRRVDDAESRLARFDHEFHKLSRVLVPPAYWRSIYKQKLYMSMTRHTLGIMFYCNLVHYRSLVLNEDRAEKAIECINLLHQGFENLIEKGGRVYRVYRNGSSFVALGNVPYGVKEDPIDSIAQLAFDFMTWAWRVKVPANLLDGFQLQIGIHSGKLAGGTLKYSTSQFFPIGPVQKEAWAIARSSAPCRILISEEFHQNLRQLAQIFIRYRIVPNTGSVFGYKGKTYWLVGMNEYRAQTLLDDIFLLDPENLEALAKWYDKRSEKRDSRKGILENEQIAVVTPLPFDYAAMTAGGTQYQVDMTPEEDRKKSIMKASSDKRFEDAGMIVEDQPVRVSDPHSILHEPQVSINEMSMNIDLDDQRLPPFIEAHIMKTRGGIDTAPTRATIVVHKEAEDRLLVIQKVSGELGAITETREAMDALNKLRAIKKKEMEEFEEKQRELAELRHKQHLLNVEHELAEIGSVASDFAVSLGNSVSEAVHDAPLVAAAERRRALDLGIENLDEEQRPRLARRSTLNPTDLDPGVRRRWPIQPGAFSKSKYEAQLEQLRLQDSEMDASTDHAKSEERMVRIVRSIERLKVHKEPLQPVTSELVDGQAGGLREEVVNVEPEPVGYLQRQLLQAAEKYNPALSASNVMESQLSTAPTRPPVAPPQLSGAPPQQSTVAPSPSVVPPQQPAVVLKSSVVPPQPPGILPQPVAMVPQLSVAPPQPSVAPPQLPVVTPQPLAMAPQPSAVPTRPSVMPSQQPVPSQPMVMPNQPPVASPQTSVVPPQQPAVILQAPLSPPQVPTLQLTPPVSTAPDETIPSEDDSHEKHKKKHKDKKKKHKHKKEE